MEDTVTNRQHLPTAFKVLHDLVLPLPPDAIYLWLSSSQGSSPQFHHQQPPCCQTHAFLGTFVLHAPTAWKVTPLPPV